jgi:hypothetical protein
MSSRRNVDRRKRSRFGSTTSHPDAVDDALQAGP